jgi:hypothetical protein
MDQYTKVTSEPAFLPVHPVNASAAAARTAAPKMTRFMFFLLKIIDTAAKGQMPKYIYVYKAGLCFHNPGLAA